MEDEEKVGGGAKTVQIDPNPEQIHPTLKTVDAIQYGLHGCHVLVGSGE